MGREKSIFEQMGGTYTEKDGILYPNIFIGEEQTEAMQDTFSGKYGDLVTVHRCFREAFSCALCTKIPRLWAPK